LAIDGRPFGVLNAQVEHSPAVETLAPSASVAPFKLLVVLDQEDPSSNGWDQQHERQPP
jgi:hypothetical protein